MNPETLRAEIPALDSCSYLNTGASSPSPRPVVEAEAEFQRKHQYQAPCGEGPYVVAADALESARETIADFLGANTSEIALTRSTVEGINHVATATDWNPGDVVVRTDLEHPAGELPWQHMQTRHGIEIRELETEQGRLDLDHVRETVDGARLVCLSSVSWNYGTRLPIEKVVDIAHKAGAKVLVDAVQSPGQIPMDVTEWGADFVAASGHKWLLGPWGAGFLYVDESALDALTPHRIGYFSVADPEADGYEFKADASRFELGTTAISPYVGLETAIETIDAIGVETIEERIQRLTDRLKSGLGDRLLSPRDARSGLVTFAADEPEQLVDRLASEGIQIRWLPEPYACRVSVHVFNTAEDIDRLLAAL